MRSTAGQLLLLLLLLLPPLLRAQAPPHVALGALSRLQIQQPPVDISSAPTATAVFDPPVARPGEKAFYRVVIDAAESSIQLPETLPAPPELKLNLVARGQMLQNVEHKFRPVTSFLYETRTAATGHFTIPNFTVEVQGRPLQIPAASLDVDPSASAPPARQLVLEVSATNLFLGQPFRARVILLASASNTIESLRDVRFNGNGFTADRTTAQRSVKPMARGHIGVPAYIFEETLTPILPGTLKLYAQAFTAGRDFSGPITITAHFVIHGGPPHYDLLVSDPVEIHVRPLPVAGQLPGFTGAIGRFTRDPPQLSANRMLVGQPVRLTVVVHSYGTLNHLVPPTPPLAKDWEIIPAGSSGFSYTLIPLTDNVRETPAIPYSYFNPATASYEDLTVPPLPVTVTGKSLPTELSAMNAGFVSGQPLKLSALSPTPGKRVAGLKPPQLRGWLLGLQMVPVLGILGLWQWDRRRRFLETHPDIIRRREARRALQREKRRLREAATHGDAAAFFQHAANAMKIACAPHYAAHPQALVCSEVLERLDGTERNGAAGETVRKIFTAADAQFASRPQTQPDWPALQSGVNAVLLKLEEKL